jgi:CheY-like chemotaxis protein
MSKKALVVDDALLSRITVKKMLTNSQIDCVEASNGREALKAIEENRFDIVFLDLLMPEMDGFEVLEALQKQNYSSPVIVISADIQKSSKTRCEKLGASGFLNKPVTEDELEKILSGNI